MQKKELKIVVQKLNNNNTSSTETISDENAPAESSPTNYAPVDDEEPPRSFDPVAPKNIGKLDMVIAFDTTGSMARYIDAVRQEVSQLIPQLFKDNEDLRLGIVAFGDYCDMTDAETFGIAYQSQPLTNDENELIKFVINSKDTCGGDGDEFYELVIKKIVAETKWREDSQRVILLIADAYPHQIGYTYKDYVVNNHIDWRLEALRASNMKIKIDTVSITRAPWFRELSAMTNGVSVPFSSCCNTPDLIRASILSRGSETARKTFDDILEKPTSKEMGDIFGAYYGTRCNPS
jgi:hypothetical protein